MALPKKKVLITNEEWGYFQLIFFQKKINKEWSMWDVMTSS